jgi:hypothetical protein
LPKAIVEEKKSMPRDDPSAGKRRALSGRKRLIVTLCVVLLLGGGAWIGLAASRLWTAASRIQADLAALESLVASDVQALDFERAIDLLHTTRADLETLQSAARPFLWMAPYLSWLPRYGPDIQAAPLLLEMALNLTAAGEEVVEPLAPLLSQVADQEQPGGKSLVQEATATLQAARPQLTVALSVIQEAQSAREGLSAAELSPRVQGWVARLDRYLPLLERGVQGVLLLPELLGADGRRTYLVLVQNEDELRPTGGFISGVAQVAIERGELLEIRFEDSYAVDDFSNPYPDPPAPLLEYMLSELWLFRDSNWSPDFPTSARAAISLYTISRDVEVNGVVMTNQQAIRRLVGALAPLQVEGYAEPITEENLIQIARRSWEPGDEITAEWWEHRKDFMVALLNALVYRVEDGLDRTELIRLAQAALGALEEKHLLVYLEDQEAAALVAELGWDGALIRSPGDYLMVVDANMGFNKVNAVVQESLEYVVNLSDPAHPRATLTIHHWHPLAHGENPCRHEPRYDSTYEQMMARCYWDYLRVYVPLGTQLLDATLHPVSGLELLSGQPSEGQVTVGPPEQEHDVLATFLLLRPSEALETRFEYTLPQRVLQARQGRAEYTLVAQKQPGTHATPLRVRVLLPAGMKVEASEPEPTLMTGSEVEYALTLKTDRLLRVTLRRIATNNSNN